MFKPFGKKITIACCLIILYSFTSWLQILGGEMFAAEQDRKPLNASDVGLAPNSIRVPMGLILLVRRSQEYCAIKFTKYWTGKTQDDEYATYESYYQSDSTGDLTNKNVKFRQGELSRPRLRGIGRLSFSFGNKDIQCGSVKLFWSGKGWVCFFSSSQKQGDYGIELAPTKWTDISKVNVFDSRLKWYRYDGNRKRINISIDQLWDDKKK